MSERDSSLTLSSTWVIELQSNHPVASFAATELQTTLHNIGAPLLQVVQRDTVCLHNDTQRIRLACGTAGDGFRRMSDDSGIMLTGDGPRGLLYAVYDLLETLGCRWVSPYAPGSYIPYTPTIELPANSIEQHPSLLGRCLIIGHDFFLQYF